MRLLVDFLLVLPHELILSMVCVAYFIQQYGVKMLFVDRLFEQIEPKPDASESQKDPRPFSAFLDVHVIVVLGDPGMGKTEFFKLAANHETEAAYYQVGQFIAWPPEQIQGKTIYLDGLEELRRDNLMNDIVGCLMKLGKPKVRISCRAIDWQGDSNIARLSPVSAGKDIIVLQLLPLRLQDVHNIATDRLGVNVAENFLQEARQYDIEELLTNPQDLELYLEVYENERGWPPTRKDLLEKATSLLLEEKNKALARRSTFSNFELMKAAEDLSAIQLLAANIRGFAKFGIDRDPFYPPLQSLAVGNFQAMSEVVGRRLFVQPLPERVEPKHRTLAEFLAAKGLVRRVNDFELPIGRILAFLTGFDGGILPDIRGLYAWLIVFLPIDKALQLLRLDPYGALVYGDVAGWPVAIKKAVLPALQELAKNDPYFRAGHWGTHHSMGRLACPELVSDFQYELLNENNNSVLSIVLDAIEHGNPLPVLGDVLLDFVRDKNRPHFLKADAIRAFVNACPDRLQDLRLLLDEVMAVKILDNDFSVRVELLRQLYPKVVAAQDIPAYIMVDQDIDFIGFGYFVRHELLNKTPAEDLPMLAATLLGQPQLKKKSNNYTLQKLQVDLLRRLLEFHGDKDEPYNIYAWLDLLLDKDGYPIIEGEDAQAVKEYIQARPALYKALFLIWANQERPKNRDNWVSAHFVFERRICNASPPHGFEADLLGLAREEVLPEKADLLFWEAADIIFGSPACSILGSNDLLLFVEHNPRFTAAKEAVWPRAIPERNWDQEVAGIKQKFLDEKNEKRASRIRKLTPKLDLLRTGKLLEPLGYFANIWLNSYRSEDTILPVERIRKKCNDEITQAVIEGFERVFKTGRTYSPAEIANLSVQNPLSKRVLPALAGADIVASRSRAEFLALPSNLHKEFLAYTLLYHLHNTPWVDWLYEDRPDLVVQTLAEYWLAQLDSGETKRLEMPNINNSTDDPTLSVTVRAVFRLLKIRPALPALILQKLLTIVIRFGEQHDLRRLVDGVLAKTQLNSVQKTLWLATAFLFNPQDYIKPLQARVAAGNEEKWACYDILVPHVEARLDAAGERTNVSHVRSVIAILGRVISNVSIPVGARDVNRHDEIEAAQEIRHLIEVLAANPSAEATKALTELKDMRGLKEWSNYLRHILTSQVLLRRQKEQDYANVSEVCELLAGRGPANVKDMQALVLDVLDELAEEIREGNTDPWSAFWNNANSKKKQGKKPKPENECRNRLLDLMRLRLQPHGIRLEPEGAAARGKRADISASLSPGKGKFPFEIKKDNHRAVWSACKSQLQRFYASDPEAKKYCIYLVLWFGAGDLRSPPKRLGIEKPSTPAELHKALEALARPSEAGNLIQIRVIDVSQPKK